MLVDRTSYTKTLCMSELRVMRTRLAQTHYLDPRNGSAFSSFVFILRGTVTLNTLGRHLTAEPGMLVYIPEGQRYHAVWRGSPEIEFLSFHIINKKIDLTATPRYAIQRVDALSTPETEALFRRAFDLFATGERVDRVRAIGLYYGFYADVLPHLRAEPPVKYNPALLGAVAYIEQNYAEDFDIHTLAAAVCVSESRLHHLFKRELGTTPVKFRNELRIEHAAGALRTTDRAVDDIAADCGFHSVVYFREIFKSITGLRPSEYRALAQSGEQGGDEDAKNPIG